MLIAASTENKRSGYYSDKRLNYTLDRSAELYLVRNSKAEKLSLPGEGEFINAGLDYNNNPYLIISKGRSYQKVGTAGYIGSKMYKLVEGEWVYHYVPAFNDPLEAKDGEDAGNENNGKLRPDRVNSMLNPIKGVTVITGAAGANYIMSNDVVVKFDSMGGNNVKEAKGAVKSPLNLPVPTKETASFTGWYTDKECTKIYNLAVMPAESITLYAGWNTSTTQETIDTDRNSVLKSLEESLAKRSATDYGEEEWKQIEAYYYKGKYAIAIASSYGQAIDALNKAIEKMDVVPVAVIKPITICVSMEKFTLGQGYIIEPILVTVDNYTQASKVIVNLLKNKYASSNSNPVKMTGTPEENFYLSSVYDPSEETPVIPQYIITKAEEAGNRIDVSAGSKDWLGEFDYSFMSGWMYSVNGNFPGVGAAGWRMTDGEVMRWQFTLHGYGADLGADNTAWGGENITDVGNKDELTWAVAELNRAYNKDILMSSPSYKSAISVLQNMQASQTDINKALVELKNNGPKYKDVSSGYKYEEAIDGILRKGLMKGTTSYSFEPDTLLTRAMAITVLHRVAGEPKVAAPAYIEKPQDAWAYIDTPIETWYGMPALWIRDKKLLEHDGSIFEPNALIMKNDLEKLIQNFSKIKNTNKIEDVASFYNKDEMITRGAFAAMIMQLIQ